MTQITLALAKGRTAKASIEILENAGLHFPDFHEKSRKLVFYNEDRSVKMIYVKAVDVTTYVEQGAADVGIAGKDNILESEADIYELLDLKLGICKFSVASLHENSLEKGTPVKVASKYTNVTRDYFNKRGIPVEVIKLNGSVELAPIIGLADYIVDIVETGNTIRENGLSVIADVADISTRLIVNKASFATKTDEIQQLIEKLKIVLEA